MEIASGTAPPPRAPISVVPSKDELVNLRIAVRAGAGGQKRVGTFQAYLASTHAVYACESETAALAFAQKRAQRLVEDSVTQHGSFHPAQAVMQGVDGAWYVGVLSAGHRGAISAVAVDGPMIDTFADSITVTRPPKSESPIRYLVGADRVFDLRSTHHRKWVNPQPAA
jgi:hypothetical protein